MFEKIYVTILAIIAVPVFMIGFVIMLIIPTDPDKGFFGKGD